MVPSAPLLIRVWMLPCRSGGGRRWSLWGAGLNIDARRGRGAHLLVGPESYCGDERRNSRAPEEPGSLWEQNRAESRAFLGQRSISSSDRHVGMETFSVLIWIMIQIQGLLVNLLQTWRKNLKQRLDDGQNLKNQTDSRFKEPDRFCLEPRMKWNVCDGFLLQKAENSPEEDRNAAWTELWRRSGQTKWQRGGAAA